MSPSSKERRHSPRVPIRLSVRYGSGAEEFKSHTVDASARGFFVETKHPLPVGTTVPFLVSHKKWKGPLELVGRVVHVEETLGRKGMGVHVEIRAIGQGQDKRFETYRSIIELARFSPKSGKGNKAG